MSLDAIRKPSPHQPRSTKRRPASNRRTQPTPSPDRKPRLAFWLVIGSILIFAIFTWFMSLKTNLNKIKEQTAQKPRSSELNELSNSLRSFFSQSSSLIGEFKSAFTMPATTTPPRPATMTQEQIQALLKNLNKQRVATTTTSTVP